MLTQVVPVRELAGATIHLDLKALYALQVYLDRALSEWQPVDPGSEEDLQEVTNICKGLNIVVSTHLQGR